MGQFLAIGLVTRIRVGKVEVAQFKIEQLQEKMKKAGRNETALPR